MPIERTPISGPGFASPSPIPRLDPLATSPGMSWLHEQKMPYEQLWKDIGDFRPGSIKGGFTDAQAFALSPEHQSQFTYERPSMGLTTPSGAVAGKSPVSRGTLSLSAIDPLSVPYQFTGQPQGVNLPDPTNPNPSGFNPGAFLADKGIDIMGNLPSRLFDYALAAPNVITGQPITNPAPAPDGSKTPYEFQYDGRYWAFVSNATDSQITDLAARTARQYTADPVFVQRLAEQMLRDRDAATGLSSGNDGVDYTAKLKLYQDMVAAEEAQRSAPTGERTMMSRAGPVTVPTGGSGDFFRTMTSYGQRTAALGAVYEQGIPFIGTDLAKSAFPIPAGVDDYWKNSLTPAQRKEYLGTAGLLSTLSATAWTLPLLSGFGGVTKLAAMGKLGQGGVTAYQVYSKTLQATAGIMAYGLASLMANTAREWVDPVYAATTGKSIDQSRPISDSAAAALVNGVGYFASGTGGASLLLRGGKKLAGGLAAATGTLADTPIYRFGLGGSSMTSALSDMTGIAKASFQRSFQRLTLSELGGELMDRQVRQMADGLAAMNRGEMSGIAELDAIDDPALRTAWANERLMQMQETHHLSVATAANLMSTAKKLLGFFSSDVEHQRVVVAQKMTQAIEDDVARRFTTTYGADFWALKGANSVEGVQAWLATQAKRLGHNFDPAVLTKKLGKNLDKWHQAARSMYHYEYDLHNATLQDAAKGSGEEGRLTLVRQTHLFADEAEDIITGLRSGDDALVREAKNAIGVRVTLQDTEEINAWWARKLGMEHGPASVLDIAPESLASDLEALQPMLMHRRMAPGPGSPHAGEPINQLHLALEKGGEWTLAYKPEFISEYMPDVGIPGEQQQPRFASFKALPDGTVLKSPFMDYQFEGAENIAIGNRGVMLGKLDDVTRGWRTWRITEFQRSSMFRILDGQGFLPNQIDRFFRDVVRLSREEKFSPGRTKGHLLVKVNPQAVGVLASEERLDKIGRAAFGPDAASKLPKRYLHADGTADWGRLIIDGFQQSRSLNLLSGVTSTLKTLPHGVGEMAIIGSDWAVPLIRFNLSALFRIGETVESGSLNLMRTADPMADALTLAAYRKAGVGVQHGQAAAEISADPMVGELGDPTKQQPGGAAEAMSMFTRGAAPEEKAALEAAQAKATPGVALPDIADIQTKYQAKLSELIDNTTISPSMGVLADPKLVARIQDFIASAPEEIAAARSYEGTGKPPRIAVTPTTSAGFDLKPPDKAAVPGQGGWKNLPDYEQITTDEPGLWHATKVLDKVLSEGLRSSSETGNVALGGSPGTVSVTYSETKAQTLVASQKMLAQYVNGHATPADVIDFFWDKSGYEGDVASLAGVIPGLKMPTGGWGMDADPLIAAVEAKDAEMAAVSPGAQQQWRFRMFQRLDEHQLENGPESQPALYVGSHTDWVGVDPENIGYVQVASNGDPVRGTSEYELQYNPGNLQVIDANAPSFIPGFEDLRTDIQRHMSLKGEDRIALNQALGDYVREVRAKLAAPPVEPQVPLTNADIAGAPENVIEHLEQMAERRGVGKAVHDLFNPGPYKEKEALRLQISLIQHDFPLALQASGSGAYKVMKEIGIPDLEMADFLVRDRQLYQAWQNSGSVPDWLAMMKHSGGIEERAGMIELYDSPEWDVVSSLWRLSAQAAQDEAFGVHFFGRYRSTLERSINHPLLGVYPASWSYKVAKEWVKFLYDNRMFGGGTLRLGMAPAVAIASIQRAQQRAFAQSDPGTLDQFLQTGPFANALFMFNLVMPGDWSSIPFPLSQSLRLAMRGDFNPLDHLARNTWGLNGAGGIGAIRDARLLTSTVGDAWDTFTGADQKKADAHWNALITTTEGQGLPRKPPDWTSITTYPH